MAIAASIDIILSATTTKLDKGLQAGSKGISTFINKFSGIGSAISNSLSSFFSVNSAISQFTDTFGQLNQLVLTSDALGIPAEKLAGIQLAATNAEISIDQINSALARFAKQADPSAGSLDEQFRAAADRISRMENPIQRVQEAIKLFGRSGAELLPILMQGAAGFDANQEAAKKYGLAINSLNAEKIREMDDSLDSLNNVWQGLWRTIVTTTAPQITTAINDITGAFDGVEGAVKAWARVAFLPFTATMDAAKAAFDFFEGKQKKMSSGASGSWDEPVGAMEDIADETKTIDDHFKELERKANSIKESLLTPTEILNRESTQLLEMFSAGLLTWDQMQAQYAKLNDEFQKTHQEVTEVTDKGPGDFLGLSNLGNVIGEAAETAITSGVGLLDSIGGAMSSAMESIFAGVQEMDFLAAPGAVELGSVEQFSQLQSQQRSEMMQMLNEQQKTNQIADNIYKLLKDIKPEKLLSLNLG